MAVLYRRGEQDLARFLDVAERSEEGCSTRVKRGETILWKESCLHRVVECFHRCVYVYVCVSWRGLMLMGWEVKGMEEQRDLILERILACRWSKLCERAVKSGSGLC